MSLYATGNPVPSSDMRDIWDDNNIQDQMINGTELIVPDRTGKNRDSWAGIEKKSSDKLSELDEKVDLEIEHLNDEINLAIEKIGWQELGDWSVGLQLTNRNQIVSYNGSWYKFLGELPHTIVGDSPDNDGGVWSSSNTDGVWANIGDAAIRSELSSRGNPGGVGLLGHKGTTLDSVLDLLSSVKISAMTDFDMYSAWAQGKVFSHKNKAYCLYNVGTSHSNAALSVYQQISNDGVSWTRPAPRISNTNATIWPQGVSAWGAGSDGTNIWCAVRFRRVSDESQSKCVLYKSTNDGSGYTSVLDPVPLYDSNNYAPVLMHSFAVLPNGLLAFGYHMYDGEVGIATVDPSTLAVSRNIIFTKEQMASTPTLVEPTLHVYGSRVVGFLRSQAVTTSPAVMWYSDDNCQTFQIRNIDGVPNQSPVSLISYAGKTYVFYCGRYRDGNTTSALTNSPLLTMRVGTDEDARNLLWENFVEVPIAAVPSIYNNAGSSGTGVQDVCVRGSKLIVCLSANTGDNVDQAEMYSVTIDLGTPRQNKFFRSEQDFVNARRATDYAKSYTYKEVNIIDMGGSLAALRFNGQVQMQDLGTGIRFGSTTSAAAKLHNFNNGTAPAYLSAEANSTNVILRATYGTAKLRAGTAASGAEISIDADSKAISLANPNNTGGISLTQEGYVSMSVNWQHPMVLDGGSGGKIYLWVSGSTNIMKHASTPPTSDSDGEFLVPNKTTTVANLGAGTDTARYAYATNGRKSGEGAGAGTGVPVYWDGAVWRVYRDDSIISA